MVSVKCCWCDYVSEPGEIYFVWDDKSFCSRECVDEYVLSDVDPLVKYVDEDQIHNKKRLSDYGF